MFHGLKPFAKRTRSFHRGVSRATPHLEWLESRVLPATAVTPTAPLVTAPRDDGLEGHAALHSGESSDTQGIRDTPTHRASSQSTTTSAGQQSTDDSARSQHSGVGEQSDATHQTDDSANDDQASASGMSHQNSLAGAPDDSKSTGDDSGSDDSKEGESSHSGMGTDDGQSGSGDDGSKASSGGSSESGGQSGSGDDSGGDDGSKTSGGDSSGSGGQSGQSPGGTTTAPSGQGNSGGSSGGSSTPPSGQGSLGGGATGVTGTGGGTTDSGQGPTSTPVGPSDDVDPASPGAPAHESSAATATPAAAISLSPSTPGPAVTGPEREVVVSAEQVPPAATTGNIPPAVAHAAETPPRLVAEGGSALVFATSPASNPGFTAEVPDGAPLEPEAAGVQSAAVFSGPLDFASDWQELLKRTGEAGDEVFCAFNDGRAAFWVTGAAVLTVALELVRLRQTQQLHRQRPAGDWPEVVAPSGLA